ncbi:MAG: sulfatase [Pirellulales bacterium]|jgi:arylsulfatase A-like enzyme
MNLFHLRTFFILLLASTSTVLAAAQPPNIVFVLADDLGYSDVGFNGQGFYETPNIDALARNGMILSDFYSGGPNCAPTRACINTGMYTPRHKLYTPGGQAKGDVKSMRFAVPTKGQRDPVYNTVDSMPNTIDGSHTSIAEVLGNAGYVPGRFGKWHLGEDLQGFTVSSANGKPGVVGKKFYGNIDVAESLTDAAVEFIEQNKKKPFFLCVAHWDVHGPLRARKKVVAKYKKKLETYTDNGTWEWNPIYAAMLDAVDTSVGRIRAKIKQEGLEDNTLFIFTSDNGGASFATTNHPLRGAKGAFFEGGIRVPTCAAWPAVIKPGTRSDAALTSVDFMPTFAELASAALPTNQPVDGRSFIKVLKGQAALQDRAIFWHYPLYLSGASYNKVLPVYGTDKMAWRAVPSSVIRKGDFKLIYYYEYDNYKLFNLRYDLSEKNDLAQKMREKAKQLHAELMAWVKDTNAPVPTKANPKFDG